MPDLTNTCSADVYKSTAFVLCKLGVVICVKMSPCFSLNCCLYNMFEHGLYKSLTLPVIGFCFLNTPST